MIREKSFGSFNQMDATQMPSPIGESFEQEKSVYPNPLETALVDPETLTARKHKEERVGLRRDTRYMRRGNELEVTRFLRSRGSQFLFWGNRAIRIGAMISRPA